VLLDFGLLSWLSPWRRSKAGNPKNTAALLQLKWAKAHLNSG
jgi:hypothetical protein